MYKLRTPKVFFLGRATYSLGSGSLQKNSPVLTSNSKVTSFTIRSPEAVMSARNAIALSLALSTLALLAGCGSGGGPAQAIAPPSGSFSKSNLNGNYVFSVLGSDADGAPYAVVGVVSANGNGGITGGTIDINDSLFTPGFGLSVGGNGTYSVGVDGRGKMNINTTTANPFANFGNGAMEFDFVLSTSFHGLITEFDGNGTSSGTLDQQTAGLTQASLAGSYAFSFSGISELTETQIIPFGTVGGFTIDSNGIITAGAEDFNNDGVAQTNAGLSGQVTLGPSSSPATTLVTTPFGTLTFDVFAIDSTHLKFIEFDSAPMLSGDAFSQTSSSISGNLAYTLVGDFSGNIVAAGGILVTDGVSAITSGSEDYNSGGAPSLPSAPLEFTGSYTSSGSLITGRYQMTLNSPFFAGSLYAAYPSSGGLLLLEVDGLGGLMSGAAYTQSTTTFGATAQGYGLNFSGDNLTNEVEVDDIAEFTAGTASSGAGTLTNGIIDENYNGAAPPTYGAALTAGTYSALDSTGRYELSADAAATLNGGFGITFYTVDGNTFPFIESDTNGQVSTGVFVLQNAAATAPLVATRSHMLVPRPLVRARSLHRKQK